LVPSFEPSFDFYILIVYSNYPFNSRSQLAIASGRDDGIIEGDVVVIFGDILVGQVIKVFDSSSIVTTIFDPSWEMAVRIGDDEIDALLKGGNELTLTLIPKDEFVEEGDKIIAASQGFPYGLEIGLVQNIKDSGGDVFKEAIVKPSFQVSELRDVAIYR